ncbi:sugar phosphate nucleotidyltransferase [Bilifractor sp. LCP21S3_A7]|uniref:sugar phosphate nucleotidyltransferase n=1 Tax=Bilifractor sp. LCP21S3_A7 TaxID=3438738 RepID=UPI003F8F3676
MDYIIVQAGGKGTRLGYLTENKPKAIVPVYNLPMLFHLFRKFPDKRFIIISDYHKDVLRRYLASFADVKYIVIDAVGIGTVGGVKQAVDLIPDNVPFMLIWSDLILPSESDFALPSDYQDKNCPTRDYIGISKTFPCRWMYKDGKFSEERSTEQGVAGFFLFHNRSSLCDVPESGELVRWMQQKSMIFDEWSLAGTKEFGLLSEYNKLGAEKTRPFNRITVDGDVLTKEPVDEQGKRLAVREIAWYEKAKDYHISALPHIYSTNPLRMEKINGKNIYECNLTHENKVKVLKQMTDALQSLHAKGSVPTDYFSMREAYYNKTIKRLSGIEDLVPFARDRYITVNGRKCRNVFFHQRELEKTLEKIKCDHFSFIHGDCTFSNLMLRNDGKPVFIDPRGYFGFTELYGDPNYDWAKLYYSIIGNYDRFNLKDFKLTIGGKEQQKVSLVHNIPDSAAAYNNIKWKKIEGLGEDEVNLQIASNHWEDVEKEFFEFTGADPWEIKLLHAVIWLSLTTYVWQDYDSVCGAFYNGLYYLEEVL